MAQVVNSIQEDALVLSELTPSDIEGLIKKLKTKVELNHKIDLYHQADIGLEIALPSVDYLKDGEKPFLYHLITNDEPAEDASIFMEEE